MTDAEIIDALAPVMAEEVDPALPSHGGGATIIKVEDGNERALPAVANNIFQKLNLFNKKKLMGLAKWTNEKIFNQAK